MKDKHKAWANLGRKPKPAPKTIIRFLDLPGIRELEDKCLLGDFDRGRPDGPFEEKLREVSMKLFGITKAETEFDFPHGYFDLDDEDPEKWAISEQYWAHEDRFTVCRLPYEDKLETLKALGWDFTDGRGDLLRVTDFFVRQAEAASKGIAGHMPDMSSVRVESWAAAMMRDAEQFRRSARQRS